VQACRTASLRPLGNTDGLVRLELGGDETVAETYGGPFGVTIAELTVLNGYRRRVWC
jgi:hypothetical protein